MEIPVSVLAEAISVVMSCSAVQRHYPGGLAALARDTPAGSFCSDGLLARAGFTSRGAAEFFAALMRASGLTQFVRGHAADYVLVDEQSGPLSACLWLEFGHDRNGVALCWHAAARRGSLRVPEGWQAGRRWAAPAHEASMLKQDCPYVTH
jgi:hypothetical protein